MWDLLVRTMSSFYLQVSMYSYCRRMFPALRVRVSGLKKLAKYRLYLDFIPVDRNKYRYVYHRLVKLCLSVSNKPGNALPAEIDISTQAPIYLVSILSAHVLVQFTYSGKEKQKKVLSNSS